MKKLLIVTAVCRNDFSLALERAEYLKRLGQKPDHTLLLVNDGTVEEGNFKALVDSHLNIFDTVITRSVSQPRNPQWPWGVNHVFRSIVRMLCSNTSSIDKTNFTGWFYFEPDVTPINPDWIAIFDQQYTFHKRPFMGVRSMVNGYRGDQKVSIECMNGAGIYTLDLGRFNAELMLADGAPWDVVGLSGGNLQQVSLTPDSAYMLTYGITECVKQADGTIKSVKTVQDGTVTDCVFKLDQHIIHHGCKDGSLMRIINPVKPEKLTAPKSVYANDGKPAIKRRAKLKRSYGDPKPKSKWTKEDVIIDIQAGEKWGTMISKHRISPADLAAIRDEVNNAVA